MHIEVYPTKEKQKQMLELLKFDTVMVFIDSRHPDVQVPDDHKNQHDLRLNFDYEFGIEDFRVLPDRLEASLSFPNGEFFCVIPLDAVYLMICNPVNRGALFAEHVPNEMLHMFFDPKNKHLPDEAKKPFKVIENPNLESPASELQPAFKPEVTTQKDTPEETKPIRKKGHLRLIK